MKKLEFWGAILTVAYLSLMGWWLSVNWAAFTCLKLNELGDFLAGTFGPVAFLWLVLGFLQQGRELKLSSDALRLQAEELRNSVEQQTRMADATVQQIQSAGKALDLQLQVAERAVVADFEVRTTMRYMQGEYVINKMIIINNRNIAYNVSTVFSGGLRFYGEAKHGTMKAETEVGMELKFEPGNVGVEGDLQIFYNDANGVPRVEVFSFNVADGDWVRFEKDRSKGGILTTG